LYVAAFDAGHLDGFRNHAVESIGFLFDDGDEFALARLEAAVIAQYRGSEFDGGERRLEFVRDGVEQERLQFLALTRGFGSRGGLLRTCAIECDGGHVRDGLRGLRRQRGSEPADFPIHMAARFDGDDVLRRDFDVGVPAAIDPVLCGDAKHAAFEAEGLPCLIDDELFRFLGGDAPMRDWLSS
jgi:hypothetical protein